MHTSGRNYFEATRYIKSKEQESDIKTEIAQKLVAAPEYPEFDSALIDRLNEQATKSSRATEYFHGRKITDASIKKFKLGYSEKQDMVTIPITSPAGVYVGFVGRSVEGKDFKNTPGLPKSKVLFNLHSVKTSTTVYVVESSFDAIRLDQCGLPAVATLGANVSGQQLGLLQKYFNNIIVVADNDEAGSMMADKIISSLGSRASLLRLDSKYKDIGDMDDSEISKLENTFDKSIAAMLN